MVGLSISPATQALITLNVSNLGFRTYEKMEKEVSNILGFRWYALNDKQFKLTHINVTAAYYFDGYEDLTPT